MTRQFRALVRRAAGSAFAALLATSVHHVYGAYAFGTPWRLHVVVVSGVAAAAMAVALSLVRRHERDALGAIAFWVFVAVALAVPALLTGVYEGLYNHALKNLLYFGGVSVETIRLLFPAPTYELPNDVFFEVTGLLQIGPALTSGYLLIPLVQARRSGSGTRHDSWKTQEHHSDRLQASSSAGVEMR